MRGRCCTEKLDRVIFESHLLFGQIDERCRDSFQGSDCTFQPRTLSLRSCSGDIRS